MCVTDFAEFVTNSDDRWFFSLSLCQLSFFFVDMSNLLCLWRKHVLGHPLKEGGRAFLLALTIDLDLLVDSETDE